MRLRVDVRRRGDAGEEFARVVARPLDAVVLLPPRELVAGLGQRDEEVAAGPLALDARRERDRRLRHRERAGVPPALSIGLAPVLVRQQRGVRDAARARADRMRARGPAAARTSSRTGSGRHARREVSLMAGLALLLAVGSIWHVEVGSIGLRPLGVKIPRLGRVL